MTHRDSFTDNFDRFTVVFVTDQFQCERLISAGFALSDATRTSLAVINITDPKVPANAAAIEHLYQISRDYGASMDVIYADRDIAGIMSRMILQRKACHVITGLPHDENSVISKLWRIHPSVNFYTVSMDGHLNTVPLESRRPSAE